MKSASGVLGFDGWAGVFGSSSLPDGTNNEVSGERNSARSFEAYFDRDVGQPFSFLFYDTVGYLVRVRGKDIMSVFVCNREAEINLVEILSHWPIGKKHILVALARCGVLIAR